VQRGPDGGGGRGAALAAAERPRGQEGESGGGRRQARGVPEAGGGQDRRVGGPGTEGRGAGVEAGRRGGDGQRGGRRLMRDAAAAAPKPLSMFTTVTPEAQELSIPSSAAMPPSDAP
jgi:hypothetical protein